jgi:hypothetical protein
MSETLKPTPKKIDKKIIGYSVVAKDAIAEMKEAVAPEKDIKPTPSLEVMSSDWKRPHSLPAQVYKIEKCPNSPDAAVYVTISDAVLNPGTEHEQIVPAEIFINSKDVSHQQWITALTRTISAIFRKGGDVGFIVDELLGICDPGAGFLQRGVWHPSLVSQVGGVIKEHLEGLKKRGIIPISLRPLTSEKEPMHFEDIDYEAQVSVYKPLEEAEESSSYPPNATICPKCNHKAAILMDGCSTCLACGDSKCN